MHMYHDEKHKKPIWTHTLSPTASQPFWFSTSFLPISMPRTLTNSSHSFNNTDFTFSQCHPLTLNMNFFQKLLPALNLRGVVVRYILMLYHEAGNPHNFNIQFPMYTGLLKHLEGVGLITSMHQYYLISIAPPTGHWTPTCVDSSFLAALIDSFLMLSLTLNLKKRFSRVFQDCVCFLEVEFSKQIINL